MAIYTTFFLCDAEDLPGAFPGFRPPLPQPVRREFRHPFTGELLMMVETREPEWEDEADKRPPREIQIVSGTGSYEEYLEERLPPFVRMRSHWAAKGLTELDVLAESAGVSAKLECALYGPPAAATVIQQIPPELLSKLLSLRRRELNAVAERWAKTMSTPEHTHSVSGERVYDDWTVGDATAILERIAALARRSRGAEQMYLLVEW